VLAVRMGGALCNVSLIKTMVVSLPPLDYNPLLGLFGSWDRHGLEQFALTEAGRMACALHSLCALTGYSATANVTRVVISAAACCSSSQVPKASCINESNVSSSSSRMPFSRTWMT